MDLAALCDVYLKLVPIDINEGLVCDFMALSTIHPCGSACGISYVIEKLSKMMLNSAM